MNPALPSAPRPAAPPNRMRSYLLVAIVAIIVIAFLRAVFAPHESKYEKIAYELTAALQADDLQGVLKYQNAETATQVTRARVGRGADELAPLGKLQSVKETSPSNVDTRIHAFTATFEKGTLEETIKFDPDDKIVGFKYGAPAPGK